MKKLLGLALLLGLTGCSHIEVTRTLNADGTAFEEQTVVMMENFDSALLYGLEDVLQHKEVTALVAASGPEGAELVDRLTKEMGRFKPATSRFTYTGTVIYPDITRARLLGDWPAGDQLQQLEMMLQGGMGGWEDMEDGMDDVGEEDAPRAPDGQDAAASPIEQIAFKPKTGGGMAFEHRLNASPFLKILDLAERYAEQGLQTLPQEMNPAALAPTIRQMFDGVRRTSIVYRVTVPGAILASNAKKVKGRTATWELTPFAKGSKPVLLTIACGPAAKDAAKDVERYRALAKASDQRRQEVAAFLKGTGIYQMLTTVGASLPVKSKEGETKSNLGAIRSAVSIHYGKNEGVYPDVIDRAPFIGETDQNYMHELPVDAISDSRRVQYLTDAQTQDDGDGKGGWLYKKSTGEVWLNLKGQDSKGRPYARY